MQSTTPADLADIASLPLEHRLTIAADATADTMGVTPTEAMWALGAAYARAARTPSLSTNEAAHLHHTARTAYRLAVAIDAASRQ